MIKMKLQNKFAFSLLPTVILPIFIVAYLVYGFISANQRQIMHEQTNVQLNTYIKTIESNSTKSLKLFEFIANQKVLQDYLVAHGETRAYSEQKKLISFFEEVQNNQEGMEEVYVFGQNGMLNFVHSSDIFFDHRKDQAWLTDLINQISDESTVTIQESNGAYRFAYTVKVKNSNNVTIGYLVGTENLNYIAPWFNIGNKSDLEGAFVMFNNEIVQKAGNVTDNTLINAIAANGLSDIEGKGHVSLSHKEGEPEQLLYLTSGPFGSTVGVIANNTSMLATQTYLMYATYIATMIVIAVLFALVYMSVKYLVINPLNLITKATKRIASGNHDVELPEQRADQLGDTMRYFNKMATNLKANHEKIHDMAYYDELTGLNNKSSFKGHLDRLIVECENSQNEIALLSIDLDDFKAINDLHGHHTGDEFLKIVAKRISNIVEISSKDHIGKYDVFVSRLAGDEFAVLIKGEGIRSYAEKISSRIITAIAEVTAVETIEIYPSASIGIALYPAHAKDEETLYKFSDIAMYEAKGSGKNTFMIFEEEMVERVVEKERLSKEIKLAIEHDAFELYLQPKYDVKKAEFNKFESLIRWMHPEDGFISPGVFIPVAEESNLIVEIGNWVMKQTCKNIRDLENLGWKDFRVSFNVSPQQLYDRNFSRNLKHYVKLFNIDPKRLEIEVTEHSFSKNNELVVKELETVRNMGVSVALDDFGTGYSSLAYIQALPLDVVKLDRSFVSKSKKCHVNLAIIKAVLNIADALKLDTVAEGVETSEEYEQMEELGVDYIQGYYFYPPMPMSKLINTEFDNKQEKIAV